MKRAAFILGFSVTLALTSAQATAQTRLLSPRTTISVPAHARHLTVSELGRSVSLRRSYDPAYDTCSRQWAFVLHGVTVAEYVACWNQLQNWSASTLAVSYS